MSFNPDKNFGKTGINRAEAKEEKAKAETSAKDLFSQRKKLVEMQMKIKEEESKKRLKEKGYKNETAEELRARKETMEGLRNEAIFEIDEVKNRAYERRKILGAEDSDYRREIDMKDSEWANKVLSSLKKNAGNSEVLNAFWEDFNIAFIRGGSEADETTENRMLKKIYRDSILGIWGADNLLEKEGLKPWATEPEIDVDYKIDAKIETRHDGEDALILVQYLAKDWKALTDKDRNLLLDGGKMINIYDEDGLNEFEPRRKNETEFEEELRKKIDKTKEGAKNYITDYEKDIGGKKVMLMMITMPVGLAGSKPIIDHKNGEVLPEIKDRFLDQLNSALAK